MDPGAVPGGSTNIRCVFLHKPYVGGAEIGSTRVVKAKFVSGMVPPLSGFIIVANDNLQVAANDNGRLAIAA